MANEEQLSILKQGVEVWNRWREENYDSGIYLYGADLSNANLIGANLSGADLDYAHLSGANLSGANLNGADLSRANLTGADLSGAVLTGSNLNEAILHEVDFDSTDLNKANLLSADLYAASLIGCILNNANLSDAILSYTVIVGVDLSNITGLSNTIHIGPSTIGTDTLVQSKGKISERFLKGCGLSDWEIEMAKLYDPELTNDKRNQILYRIYDLQTNQAIQIAPLFISYNHSDAAFVNKIEDQLNQRGIRFWRDIHDLKVGRIEKQIDQAISQNRTVLLVLSEHSLKSDWVEHEVRKAREISKETGRDTLCPVALDDSWKTSPWPARVMEQIKEYNILDFSDWQNESTFERTFNKLVDGLGLFYK